MAVADIRALAAALALLTLSGCAYVHFGRLPPSAPQVAQENSDLRLEKTILQQELAIAHKEGDALRTALGAQAGGGARENELASKLETANRELADLRTRNATMQETLARPPAASGGTGSAAFAAAIQTRLIATEEQLATALRDYAKLQEDNARLRQDLDRARGENAALSVQVRDLVTRNRETQAALFQLNSELLAQKESRTSAPLMPGSAATPTASLSTDSKLGQPAATPGAAGMMAAAPTEVKVAQFATVPPRIHQVAAGETLETIATKYYGNPERSHMIYDANEALLRDGQRLTPGMKLVIPGEPNPAP